MNKPIKIQSKTPKLLRQRIGKSYYKTLGTCIIKSPKSLPSLSALSFQLTNENTFEFSFVQFLYFCLDSFAIFYPQVRQPQSQPQIYSPVFATNCDHFEKSNPCSFNLNLQNIKNLQFVLLH